MATAKITLLGLYNWDNTIFDNMSFPTGIDADLAKNVILMDGAEFEVLYPDPDIMRSLISFWSAKNLRRFEKWQAVYTASYDPISNYDRHEEWDESENIDEKTGTTASGSTEVKVSAYDSDVYRPKEKDESSSTADGTRDSDRTNKKTGRAWGNIGVTTTQEMMRQELDIADWVLYDHIADAFFEDFCVRVYS